MQAVLLFAAKAASAIGLGGSAAAGGSALATATASAAAAGFTATPAMLSAGAAGATAAGTGLSAASILGALRVGTGIVTALSVNAQAQMQAEAMRAEAFDAELQSRQELIQAQERSNEIEREFVQFSEQALAAASASGFDLGSLSVREQRERARADADRQLTITRNGAFMNASLRKARATTLRRNAALTAQAGQVSALGEVGRTAIDVARLG